MLLLTKFTFDLLNDSNVQIMYDLLGIPSEHFRFLTERNATRTSEGSTAAAVAKAYQ